MDITKDDVLKELNSVKESLETTLKDASKKEIEAQVKEAKEAFEKQIKELSEKPAGVTADELMAVKNEMAEVVRKNQVTVEAFDLLQSRIKDKNFKPVAAKSLGETLIEKMQEHGVKFSEGKGDLGAGGEIEKALKSQGGSYVINLGRINLKAQGSDMTLANTLTGDQVATYNQRQALVPAQAVNIRDFMPTTESPTGLYVTYAEADGETNNIVKQTEGATKGQNEYTFTEIKTVSSYVAGFSVFSKQLLKFLPFMQNTLTRALMRDFFKTENAQFFATISGAATGSTSGGTSPDNVKQLVNVIAAQKDANYNPSYILVSNSVMASLIISTYTTGYYAGAGSVAITNAGGVISIWGVPVFSASWVTQNYALIVDSSYLERVETEGLNVAFSFEDASNFRANKVTARIECMEEVNLMRASSVSYINLGAS